MKVARLALAHDADAMDPIHEAICTSSDLDREVILGGRAVDGVETVTSFVYGEPAPYESVLAADERLRERVREYEITPADDGFFLYLRRDLDAGGLSLLDALSRETVVVVPPIEIRADRTTRLTLVGHPSDLSAVVEALAADGTVDVRWTSDTVRVAGASVTDRQLAALRAARDVGYFEVPRRNGIEAVADELGCAVSTASTLIRRGEAAIVDRALDGGR